MLVWGFYRVALGFLDGLFVVVDFPFSPGFLDPSAGGDRLFVVDFLFLYHELSWSPCFPCWCAVVTVFVVGGSRHLWRPSWATDSEAGLCTSWSAVLGLPGRTSFEFALQI